MTIKIYDVPKSGHAHRVRLAASLMKIPFELAPVADMEGERKGPDYLELNPFGQVPVIVDDGFVVRDSNVILIYLAEKYAAGSHWIPSDLKARTQMHEWMAVAAGVMFRGPNMARLIKLFGRPADHEEASQVSGLLFDVMNTHLNGRTWLVGDQPTLADVSCYSYMAVANEGDLNLAPFANVRSWLSTVEGLEGFLDIPRS